MFSKKDFVKLVVEQVDNGVVKNIISGTKVTLTCLDEDSKASYLCHVHSFSKNSIEVGDVLVMAPDPFGTNQLVIIQPYWIEVLEDVDNSYFNSLLNVMNFDSSKNRIYGKLNSKDV